jgi:hypothetical protein
MQQDAEMNAVRFAPNVQVRTYLAKLKLTFLKLEQEAARVADAIEQNGSSQQAASGEEADVSQQLRQLAQQLRSTLASYQHRTLPVLDTVEILREQALPQAEALAQLLWQHWQQPEQQAAARLELAQAAATHCCAYLRCAQLGTQGGPAAGEGAGSKRCSGCHVAWYCGAACQHADWRAGHSKVCKALAAA